MADASFCLRCGAPLETVALEGRERRRCSKACGFVFYDNPLPVVAAIVEQDDHVILVHQRGWPADWFGLVTGFLERGESPEEGVVREVREELGVESEVASLVGAYPFAQRNELIVAYHVRAGGEIALGEELDAMKRVPIAKLRPWPFATGLAVRDWLARR